MVTAIDASVRLTAVWTLSVVVGWFWNGLWP